MNILGLVFSILLIVSYSFYACWDKQLASSRLRSTYIAHQKANRKILNSFQSEIYDQLRSQSKPTEPKSSSEKGKKKKKTLLNRDCAKINLWPLIENGREKHPLLYELTAKMIRNFYGSLSKENRFEYNFLNAFLEQAKANLNPKESFLLEKLNLGDYKKIYYKMLKGTKQRSLTTSYPSFLDFVKVEETSDKICLFHAHPDLITVCFNPSVAAKLYEEIHGENGSLLTQELIEKICSEARLLLIDPEIFTLLQFGPPTHSEKRKTFIAEEKGVSLRRDFYVK